MRDEIVSELENLLQQARSRIHHCVEQLSHEQLWWRPASGQNSVGIVLRHVTGNLRQWAIAGFTTAEDTRDRDSEFANERQPSATELLNDLDAVVAKVAAVLEAITTADLSAHRTIQGFDVSGLGSLMHTIPHLVGHTHQIVALTRMQLKDEYRFHWDPQAPRDVVPL